MTDEQMTILIHELNRIHDRMSIIEDKLNNRLKINKVIDVNHDNVHRVMEVVKRWTTASGVIIQVK